MSNAQQPPAQTLTEPEPQPALPENHSIAIGAKQLRRDYGRCTVLRDVTFQVSPGRICALLGRNGSGKTTLLKLLCGLIEPTGGHSQLFDDLQWPRSADALKKTGCVLDGFEPPGRTSLKELLALSAAASADFDQKRAAELLETHRLKPTQLWKTLSKGQKRWVLLVMQLCRGCEVLLLDEPADGLDPQTRIELYRLLRREANNGQLTALVATHVITDIERVADDVCILHEGKILLQADIEELREQVWVIDCDQSMATSESPLPKDVHILHEQTAESTQTRQIWVRDTAATLQSTGITGEIRRRRSTLEELFLAVTTEGAT